MSLSEAPQKAINNSSEECLKHEVRVTLSKAAFERYVRNVLLVGSIRPRVCFAVCFMDVGRTRRTSRTGRRMHRTV